MLAMLYKYYAIFTPEFQETLNHYLTSHVFNQLFMHWSYQVRNIFHLLLRFKVSQFCKPENPEHPPKAKLSFSHHDYHDRHHHEKKDPAEAINANLLSLR